MNIDTRNIYPSIIPLFYKGEAQNNGLLRNPLDRNISLDMSSRGTSIKPSLNAVEGYGSTLPIKGNDIVIPFGPIYIKKTVLEPEYQYTYVLNLYILI
jgi:hypothetical protein